MARSCGPDRSMLRIGLLRAVPAGDVGRAVPGQIQPDRRPRRPVRARPESYPRLVPDLILHARSIQTVFDLLGHDENDMTAALGWGLARNAALFRGFVARVAIDSDVPEVVVELQTHNEADRGFTDIELRCPELHIIVEAKRGWSLP